MLHFLKAAPFLEAARYRAIASRGACIRSACERPWFVHAGAVLLALSFSFAASAQLASRPAEEWSKTLEQPSRLEGLKIAEIVSRLGLKPGQVVADLGEIGRAHV